NLWLEPMDAWLEWAPRMRAAHAEVRDNMAALAVAIQRTGCDVAQARMSELERDMQPLAEDEPMCSSRGFIIPRLMRRPDLGGSLEATRVFIDALFIASRGGPTICRRVGRRRSFPNGSDQPLIALGEVNRVALADDAFH